MVRSGGDEAEGEGAVNRIKPPIADPVEISQRPRRCLQAVPHALSRHAALRYSVELLMDERDQLLEGTLVAVSPLDQESSDFRIVRSNPGILGLFDAHRGLTKARCAHKILGRDALQNAACHRTLPVSTWPCVGIPRCATRRRIPGLD